MPKVLLTSGGTYVPIDSVRRITNMSRGTFGSRIAHELLKITDDELIFLHALRSTTPFTAAINAVGHPHARHAAYSLIADLYRLYDDVGHRYTEVPYTSLGDYADQLERLVRTEKPDVVILAAAVSGFVVVDRSVGKIASCDRHEIQLVAATKLIGRVKQWHPQCKLVGFKLLVDSTDDELIAAAKASIAQNGCDIVVANDLRDIRQDNHRILIVRKDSVVEHRNSVEDPYFLARMVAYHATRRV